MGFSRYRSLSLTATAVALVLGFALLSGHALAGDPCATGTSTATFVGSPLGDWQYCAEITWDTGGGQGSGLSHLDLLLGLGECPCACEDFSFGADDTAGVSDGLTSLFVGGDSCTVYYTAIFTCDDPAVPGEEGPSIKFEYFKPATCYPGPTGTGTFCFYSDWPPAPIANPFGNIIVKFGQGDCLGDLSGVLPACSCTTPTESNTWGRVKSLYR